MTDWKTVLAKWKEEFGCTVLPPVSPALREAAFEAVGPVPADLVELYEACNGVSLEAFKIFPIEDRARIKQTWDSLVRANTPGKSQWLYGNGELQKRFLVFGEFYNRVCVAIGRDSGRIWFEEENEDSNGLTESELDLEHFIELCLREVYDDVI